MKNFLEIFENKTSEEFESQELNKGDKQVIQIIDDTDKDILSEVNTQTKFTDNSIQKINVTKLSFGSDGLCTNPSYELARCYHNHIISQKSIAYCGDCGRPLCPLEQNKKDGLILCNKCSFIYSLKTFWLYLVRIILIPFYE